MSALADYGRAGLVGVLTPQANTTVEPEIWTLLPPGWSMINARLTSSKDSIEARLVDYTTRFDSTCAQFANAPVDVLAAACTGASYLIGAAQEAALVNEIEAKRGVPFLTAALASVAALRALDARKIALLSPYPASLNAASIPYWQGHGFEVVDERGPELQSRAFHPIYAMAGSEVAASYRTLSASGADAVLMLGTGMATLHALAIGRAEGLIPAISCNLALVWAACQKRRWDQLDPTGLADWQAGAHWQHRLDRWDG